MENKNICDILMEIERENLTIEEIKCKYNLQNDDIIFRIISLKQYIETERHKHMSYSELLTFLKYSMEYDDMQIYLMKKEIEGVELTLDDKLKKFFELKSNTDILISYYAQQNYDQNNIDSLSKILK